MCDDREGGGDAVGESGGQSRFDCGGGWTQAVEEDGELCPDFRRDERDSQVDLEDLGEHDVGA